MNRSTFADISDYEMAYQSFCACKNPDEKNRLLADFKNNLSDDTRVKLRLRIPDFDLQQ